MFFSVPVPGFGSIFVEADDSRTAIRAVQQFLSRNRIRLEEGSAVGNARVVEPDQASGELVLDSNGSPTQLEPPVEPEPANGLHSRPAPG